MIVNRRIFQFLSILSFVAVFLTAKDVMAQDQTTEVVEEAKVEASGSSDLVTKGEEIFKAKCAACHYVTAKKLIGPGLKGVSKRYEKEWLYKWIKNSQELVKSGDPDAVAIFEEYKSIMPVQTVSNDDIDAILEYIANPPVKEGVAEEELKPDVVEDDGSMTTAMILLVLILVFFVFAFIYNKKRAGFAQENAAKEGRQYEGPSSMLSGMKHLFSGNKTFFTVVIIMLSFAGLLMFLLAGFEIGVHQGYKPEQPIRFSHKVHAGDNEIDCNYCHSSARHSKTSGIPSLNVCMNCHKYVDGSSGGKFKYNGEVFPMDKEIQKLYDALDYDKDNQVYGDNPQPVKWVKVHNLPDHVFFSHKQHVTVGGQKCQKCHGAVEEMDVVSQHAKLTMGWCVDCHRSTSVGAKGNGYYDDFHERMTKEYKDKLYKDGKLTVNDIGGLECAKCHY